MSHQVHIGHENANHEYVSPLDYDQEEKMRLEQDRLGRATSRGIPVVKKHYEIQRAESYNSIPKGNAVRFALIDKQSKETLQQAQSFLDPRGRIPAQHLKNEWGVNNLYWESGQVVQSDSSGFSIGTTSERFVNLYGDNESIPHSFDTRTNVQHVNFSTGPVDQGNVTTTLSSPVRQQSQPQIQTQQQPQQTGPVNFCPNCGQGCKGMKFCGNCGGKCNT